MNSERGKNDLGGESSPQTPNQYGSVFFYEPRGFGWDKVEAILRTYIAGGARPGRTTFGERDKEIQRGAYVSELWRNTIALKLERDPNRVPSRQWRLELQMPLVLAKRRMPAEPYQRLSQIVKPEGTRINIAGLWAEVDAILANLENIVADIETKNTKTGGQLRDFQRDLRDTCMGWLDITSFFRTHYAYKRSMKWLGQEFKRCADNDRSFLQHVEY